MNTFLGDVAGLRCTAFRVADFFAVAVAGFLSVAPLRTATRALDFFAALFLTAVVALRVLAAADLRVEVAGFGRAPAARLAADFFATGFFFAAVLLEADVRDAGLRAVVFFLAAALALWVAAFFEVFFTTPFAAGVFPLTFVPDAVFFRAGVFFVALRVAIRVSFSWNLMEPLTPLPLALVAVSAGSVCVSDATP